MKLLANILENIFGMLIVLLCVPFMKKGNRYPDIDVLLSEYDGKDEGNGEIA